MDEVKFERLKEELTNQLEVDYKNIVKAYTIELENLKEECNKLRYETTFLKSANEHDKAEFQSLFDQIKLKHDVEVNKYNSTK